MSVVLTGNSLLNVLMIVLSSKGNGLFTGNTIDHGVLLSLEQFQRHENYYNSCRIKYEGHNLKDKTLFKASLSKKQKVSPLIK